MSRAMTRLALLAAVVAAAFIAFPAHASQDRVIKAYVSILPQEYFAKRMAGARAGVQVLVGPGQSHETYEPTPQQIAALARTDIYFTIGAPFEKAVVPKIRRMFPGLDVKDTSAGVPLLSFAPGSGEQGLDPHVWLDPKRAKTIARNVCAGFKGVDPRHGGEYDANLAGFLADLDSLDSRIARILAPVKGRTIYVFHPAFQYFCQSYGLRQQAFESEGKEPSARQMARLIEEAKKDRVKVVFVQPQFSQKAARAIAQAIGGRVVTLNPLPEDYLKDMEGMAAAVRDALTGEAPGPGGAP